MYRTAKIITLGILIVVGMIAQAKTARASATETLTVAGG